MIYFIKYLYVIFLYKIMDIGKLLQILGLTKHESAIYYSLLQTGPAKISIISRQTGLHRPTIYQTIPNLIKKSLLTHSTKGKQKIYIPEPPEKLKKLFFELADNFDNAIPEMNKLFETFGQRPIVKFLEGKEGIKKIHQDLVDSLKKDSIYYRYTSNLTLKRFKEYLPKNYQKIQENKKLQRLIINNVPVSREDSFAKKQKLDRLTKTIPLETSKFEHDINQIIYDNKVVYIDSNTETAFVIENKKIADFHRDLFQILWKKLP